ncbi:sterol desaturase family protein [Labrys wisconsinensis]|uniref:Sterol desaturase/sphingolipid hydroxylase (Fatty acid hydroxylase superfamily) n=1 Tax=Labrys wisconsinensis TaxID=425677 RepID=A0ABU0J2U4_9HYPH|nr:sterol desaturase family protein [Labrys wisconsinensis]MDQ0468577.1 sterol desaturase/sphingolipid hydroxylase (fatty acid hydroxylase superfamily) [Labrys wisconsinensis]
MDDTLYGKRDKRGDWKPFKPIQYPPVFVWPAQPVAFVKWLFGYPGYILPWNLLYAAVGAALWLWLTPPMDEMRSFAPGWIAYLLARNAAIVFLFFGAFHLRLYIQKRQGTAFKFNGKWPSTGNSAFLFGNQTVDNMIWTFASAVPLWTAYEAVTLWAFANGFIPFVDFAMHPVYGVALMLLVPAWRDVHFYAVHRLIHWPPLYHAVHKLHHNNVNPGPWSGLAMHPVEHLLYFSCVLIHWVVPSHPVHALFSLAHAALAPAPGHAGFDKLVVGEETAIDTHSYDHYLHHKFFECNYADGVVPLDKWFGTFHDGSTEAEVAMNRRFMERARRQAEKRARRESKAN